MALGAIDRRPNGRWRARYRGPDHKRHSNTFSKRADAERWLRSSLASIDSGGWVSPVMGRVKIVDFAADWMVSRVDLRESTQARDNALLEKHVLPRFGSRTLSSVTVTEIQRMVADLQTAGLAPATVAKIYQLAAAVFEAAVTSGMIVRSPCRGISLPRDEQEEMKFLTPAQVAMLAEAVPRQYRALVLCGAFTGLRIGEMAGLRVGRLDMLRRTLVVIETVSEVNGRVVFGEPKTKASKRTITLPATLVEVLAAHLAEFGTGESGLVFTAPAGGPLRRNAFRNRVWIPATRKVGLEGVRVHDLRHTHAAFLIAQGEHPKTIQARLGHASISTTLDVYGHLFEGLDQAAAEGLNDTLLGVMGPRWVPGGSRPLSVVSERR